MVQKNVIKVPLYLNLTIDRARRLTRNQKTEQNAN